MVPPLPPISTEQTSLNAIWYDICRDNFNAKNCFRFYLYCHKNMSKHKKGTKILIFFNFMLNTFLELFEFRKNCKKNVKNFQEKNILRTPVKTLAYLYPYPYTGYAEFYVSVFFVFYCPGINSENPCLEVLRG